MDTKEKIAIANEVLGTVGKNSVKRLSNDGSLIERELIEKIIITEDGRELLKG